MRKCNFCKVEKEATREFFYVNTTCRGGLSTRCKECYRKAFYKKNAERTKMHRIKAKQAK